MDFSAIDSLTKACISQNCFYLCFQNLKSSSTWLIPVSLYEGTFFYYSCWVSFPFLSPSTQRKLVTLTLGIVDYIISLCLIMIIYVDFINEISMLKVEAMLKLASFFALTSNTFDKKIVPWRLSCYVNLYSFVSRKYYSWKVLLR